MTTQETTIESRNGVSLTQLNETVRLLEGDPSLATCHFRATNTWVNGGHNRASLHGFFIAGGEDESRSEPFTHEIDEPPVLLGENMGANPVEFVLTALSGCLTTTLVYYAAIMGIELKSVSSTLEGDLNLQGFLNLNKQVRKGYENIRVSFDVDAEAPREKIEELIQVAKDFSPVCDIVSNPVPVTVGLAD